MVSQKNWMSILPNSLRLAEVCMPGSHDAGMWWTSTAVSTPWSVTQRHPIRIQTAEHGARYFDIRPKFPGFGDQEFITYHGPVDGPPIREHLIDVKNFLDENPSEFVIFNIQDCKRFDSDSADGKKVDVDLIFVKAIHSVFGKRPSEYLLDIDADEHFSQIKLEQLRKKNYNSC